MEIERIMRHATAHAEDHPDRIVLGSYREIALEDRTHVATQVRLGAQLRRKLPRWASLGAFVPSPLTLEQCSSQATAELKARLFVHSTDTILDLTGGLGVDFVALASVAQRGIYVEQSAALVQAAEYNLPRLLPPHTPYSIVAGSSVDSLTELLSTHRPSLLYVDPARREGLDTHRRVYAIEDCTPDLKVILATLLDLRTETGYAPRLVVKLSPMLDLKHSLRSYPSIRGVYIVALRGEVKELLLAFDLAMDTDLPEDEIPIHAIDLSSEGHEHRFTSTYAEEQVATSYAPQPSRYIYEPNAAIMKSGLFASLGLQLGLKALHQHSHLFTADTLLADFPGRTFECLEVIPFSSSIAKGLRKRLERAEISCRNFPLRPDALRTKLRIASGGDTTLMGTTLLDGAPVLLRLVRP